MSAELLLAVGKSFLFAFAAILPILDPAATAPIFLGLASERPLRVESTRSRQTASWPPNSKDGFAAVTSASCRSCADPLLP